MDACQCHSPMQWAVETSAWGPGSDGLSPWGPGGEGPGQSPVGTTHQLSRTTASGHAV